MSIISLEVPYAVDLTKEKGWSPYQDKKYTYFIVRYHLHIEEGQSGNTTSPGEILASFRPAGKVEAETITAVEREHAFLNLNETVCTQFAGRELSVQIASEVADSLEIPPFRISSKVGASLGEKIQDSINFSSKKATTVSFRQTQRFEIHKKIYPNEGELTHAVACYKHMKRDVFLHYIDFLFIVYEKSYFGLRKKKHNLPCPVSNVHPNRFLVNQPLFTMSFWQILPESSTMYTESEYRKLSKIVNPDEVSIRKLRRKINLYLPEKVERPTLYTLSNIAFPMKWIDRKNDGEWTEEELKKIEMDEAEGSYWWFQYGPGKKNNPSRN